MILAHDTAPAAPAPLFDPAEAARGRLRESSYPAVRHVSCEHREGALYLRGRLSSYYLKQVAQETVGRLAGPLPVVNLIEVT